MRLDDWTIGQAKELAGMFQTLAPHAESESVTEQFFGYSVVVLDRGFVYVGEARRTGDMLRIQDARNIRYWGTDKGLHQLVLSGPTSKTRLDEAANIQAPMRAVISIHETDAGKWTQR